MVPMIPPPTTLGVVVLLARGTCLPPRSPSWATTDVYNDERSPATTTTRRRSTAAFWRLRPFDFFAFEHFLVNLEELAFLISD